MKFNAMEHNYKENDVSILRQTAILIWREQPQESKTEGFYIYYLYSLNFEIISKVNIHLIKCN